MLIKFQEDAKETWCIMKEIIGKAKINKSFLPSKIVTDKTEILGETNIANQFNDLFTNIDLKLVKKIQESSQPFESYMKNVSLKKGNKSLSFNELEDPIFLKKLIKVQVIMTLFKMYQ